MSKKLTIAAVVLVVGATFASAHTTFEAAEAQVGASHKAVLRVPHGCEGAD
ncbi:hypothetical protein SS05631_a44470 (plasmid) [Sinorhizobium sp. CCBAU 05631]|nr:hypothetical protein SS05631_a44470 [Sinorhizobium sp. CCBAU 05631]